MRASRTILLALVFGALACRHPPAAPPTPAAVMIAPAPAVPSSKGCGNGAAGSGEAVRNTITVRGAEREFFVFVPARYDHERPYPLLFVLHGYTGNGNGGSAQFARTSGEDAIVISPSAIAGKWDLEPSGADFEFLDSLRTLTMESRCVEPARVFSYGFSMGGAMSTVYACGRPGALRAFGSNMGGLPAGMPACAHPTAAWFANSAADPVVKPSWYEPVHEAWGRINGCAADKQAIEPAPCTTRSGCGARAPVVECFVDSPHRPNSEFTIPAAWRFFSSLR